MTLEQGLIDRILISELIQRERAARDARLWKVMAACWYSEAEVNTSWFRGSGAEFVAATERNAATSKTLSFHEMGPSVIEVRGDRALADTGCAVHGMLKLKQVEVGTIGYTRLLNRVVKIEGKWLLAGGSVIYISDLLVPRNPTQIPEIDTAALSGFRESYRYGSYVLTQSGHAPRTDLPGVDRPETVTAVRDLETRWLNGQVD